MKKQLNILNFKNHFVRMHNGDIVFIYDIDHTHPHTRLPTHFHGINVNSPHLQIKSVSFQKVISFFSFRKNTDHVSELYRKSFYTESSTTRDRLVFLRRIADL